MPDVNDYSTNLMYRHAIDLSLSGEAQGIPLLGRWHMGDRVLWRGEPWRVWGCHEIQDPAWWGSEVVCIDLPEDPPILLMLRRGYTIATSVRADEVVPLVV